MTTKKLLVNLLSMLGVVFVLGAMLMTVTEFKLDEMTSVIWTVVGLHVVVALGILIHAVMYVAKSTRKAPAVWGLVNVVVATVAGGVLMGVDNAWLTFAMALGFVAAFVIYGRELLYAQVQSDRSVELRG